MDRANDLAMNNDLNSVNRLRIHDFALYGETLFLLGSSKALEAYGGFKKSSCSPEGKPAQNPKHCELKGFGQQKQSLPGRVFQELADKPDADRLLRRPARAGQTKLKPQFQSRLGVTVAGSPVG